MVKGADGQPIDGVLLDAGPEASELELLRTIAVSYTHLDVYKRQTLDSAALEAKYAGAAGRAWGNYGFYMGTSTSNLEAIRALDPKAAPGIKIFMGASTGNMLVDDPEVLDAVFRDAPTPIITHCEDTPMISANEAQARERWGDDIPADQHPLILSLIHI